MIHRQKAHLHHIRIKGSSTQVSYHIWYRKINECGVKNTNHLYFEENLRFVTVCKLPNLCKFIVSLSKKHDQIFSITLDLKKYSTDFELNCKEERHFSKLSMIETNLIIKL